MIYFRFGSRRRRARLDLERKLTRQVEAGRKLVIYDQETGLLASWYLALRCEEECYRSRRYGRSLSLLVVRAVGESEPWLIEGRLADRLRRNTRASDIVGHLGRGSFVAMLPETDFDGAALVAERLRRAVPEAETSISCYPQDGESLEELVAAAGKADSASELAAETLHRIVSKRLVAEYRLGGTGTASRRVHDPSRCGTIRPLARSRLQFSR